MPRQYGSPTTCWRRLKQWSEEGTWERVWRALLSRMDAEERIKWAQSFWMVDLFPPKKGKRDWKNKVGKGTKVMMVADGKGVPIGLYLDSAQHHEIRLAEAILKNVSGTAKAGVSSNTPQGTGGRQSL